MSNYKSFEIDTHKAVRIIGIEHGMKIISLIISEIAFGHIKKMNAILTPKQAKEIADELYRRAESILSKKSI